MKTNKESTMKKKVEITINGKSYVLLIEPHRTLLDVIREEIGLTGTKKGCDSGDCGACTVLMDGKAVNSCLILAVEADGKEVGTIEGMARGGILHPLQQAFIDHGAVQCGYCTPGMIMTAKELLDNNPTPTEQEVKEALAGSICRCTGYKKIVEAVQSASRSLQELRDPKHLHLSEAPSPSIAPPSSEGSGRIGCRVQPLGLREKALGLTQFAADIYPDQCVHLKIVRSEKHHALILGIDAEEALASPGVIAVFTARDIRGTNRIGPIRRDQPVLADKQVRFLGEAIALVAAESQEAAEAGVARVSVRYEDLPAVFDPEEALKADAPKLHEDSENLLAQFHIRKGDTERGFAESYVVVESVYETPFNAHGYIEPEAGVAWRDEEGRIVIRLCTQNPHENQAQAAAALDIPPEQLRVIQAPTGGGFGGKMNHQVVSLLGLAVSQLERPARLIFTADESMTSVEKRHPFRMRFKTGATREGNLVAMEAELTANGGAYASYGKAVVERALIHATGPYVIPHVAVSSRCVYTNTIPAGAMRGFGAPQAYFAGESQMDQLAEKLGLDPFEFRRKNLFRPGSVTATGQVLDESVGADLTLDAVEPYYRKALAWAAEDPGNETMKRGVGLAVIFYGIGEAGFRNPSHVGIRLNPAGWIDLLIGGAELGQGLFSTLTQIAAQTLDVPLDHFRVVEADTSVTPSAGPTEASRMTMWAGSAVLQAAEMLRKAFDSAVVATGATPIEWPKRLAALYDACCSRGIPVAYEGCFEPSNQPINHQSGQGTPHTAYAFATHLAQVEVDEATGLVNVVKLVAAHDVGRAINPLTLEGQIEGGLMMALGFALKEEYLSGGTQKWAQYKLPRITELPEIINLIVESPSSYGPLGAKGIGEVPAVGPASAIVNAVANACGVRAHRLPLTPARIRGKE